MPVIPLVTIVRAIEFEGCVTETTAPASRVQAVVTVSEALTFSLKVRVISFIPLRTAVNVGVT